MLIIVETKVVKASREALMGFTRRSLREYAKYIGVERGRNKKDVINNLLKSGKATLCASLELKSDNQKMQSDSGAKEVCEHSFQDVPVCVHCGFQL